MNGDHFAEQILINFHLFEALLEAGGEWSGKRIFGVT
jgi:hypothetical protein